MRQYNPFRAVGTAPLHRQLRQGVGCHIVRPWSIPIPVVGGDCSSQK